MQSHLQAGANVPVSPGKQVLITRIDDLGQPAHGDAWLTFTHGRRPSDGREVGIGSLSRGGFMVIDPVERQGRQVLPAEPGSEGWGVAQAPDGAIYQGGYRPRSALLRWDWSGTHSVAVARTPTTALFSIDVAPDGCVYLPDYTANRLFRYVPAAGGFDDLGSFAEYGEHIRDVYCAPDGWVYVTATDYRRSCIVGFDPRSGERQAVAPAEGDGVRATYTQLIKDGAGHVLTCRTLWGRTVWMELLGGQAVPIDQARVQVAQTRVGANHVAASGRATPLAFSDGAFIGSIVEKEVTVVDAEGTSRVFTLERQDAPLRVFSVESGGGRIWGGTFIPLTLFSHDPASGESRCYGNPTETGGEIYNAVWSRGKLFMASYTGATLTRYAPDRPWRLDHSTHANPAHLGLIKTEGRSLQRPHGRALGPDGAVYFAAHGGYGCEDSGLCRIDPDTEEVRSWIYPDTTFHALTWVPATGRLLVSECRKGETGVRFTFISPETGTVEESRIAIADQGCVTSWLAGAGDLVYGMHSWRATLFAYSLSERRIVAELRELRFGDQCHNMLVDGPDGRIWGLTNRCIYAAERDLSQAEEVAAYEDHAGGNFYRFGMVRGPDGHLYFPNGTHLMRARVEGQ